MDGLSKIFGDAFVQFLFFVVSTIFGGSALGNSASHLLLCYIEGNHVVNAGFVILHKCIEGFRLWHRAGKTIKQKTFSLWILI